MMVAMAAPDQDRVAEYVRTRRGELGLTQAQLASKARIDTGTISSLERAERWPWTRNRTAIDLALGWMPGGLERIGSGREPLLVNGNASGRPGRPPDATIEAIRKLPDLTDDEKRALEALARGMRAQAEEDRKKGNGA